MIFSKVIANINTILSDENIANTDTFSKNIGDTGSIKNIHRSYFRNLKFVFSILICSSSVFCILALGSGQRLLYWLGSGLVLVLVLRFCAYSYGGLYS